MQQVFIDPGVQAQFDRDGYVKLKLFTPEQITALRTYYEEVRSKHEAAINDPALYSSVETGDSELLIAIDQLLKGIVKDQIKATFQNVQPMISNFLIKNSGDTTELMPHQDLTFVDEPDHCSFNLWIPLQKTDSHSGQLRFLPGSHRIIKTLRVVPSYPRPYLPYIDTMRALSVPVETEIGECVVINHAVIHGSSANLTGQPRVAIIMGFCSAGTDMYYHYMPDGDHTRIEKYRMREEDFYHFKPDGRPVYAQQVATIAHTFDPISGPDFKKWVRRQNYIDLWTKAKLIYFRSYKTSGNDK
ncbi:MAG: phytanoyl-CoA dioxygenase family protein [Bacteroidetes bacterium]|nr:phytanoyl-CoA dioxygenase family protein [Bacteroidota bacterium]